MSPPAAGVDVHREPAKILTYVICTRARRCAAATSLIAVFVMLMLAEMPPATGLAQQAAQMLVLGYYVPYDATSWASLQAPADMVDVVAAQWVSIDGCGGLTTRDDQTLKTFAHARGLMVVPSLFTLSAWLNHRLLTDDGARQAAIRNIVGYTVDEGYDGFDLDLEGVDAADRDAFTEFVTELAGALHEQGKLLTLALPAKDHDATTGWAGAYDYASLGQVADVVTVMAYEYRGPFSGPGSVAPYDWVGRVAAFAASQIGPARMLLGVAFYGYDWNTTSGGAQSLGFPQAMALAEHVQAEPVFDSIQQSLTFSYTADAADRPLTPPAQPRLNHVITTRNPTACDAAPPPEAARPTPTATSVPEGLQTHEVWVEDAASVTARLSIASADNVRGAATWRLGLEDPGVWPVIAQWRAAAMQ